MATVCSIAFFAGMYVEQSRTFPYSWVHAANKTVQVNLGWWEEPEDREGVKLDRCDPNIRGVKNTSRFKGFLCVSMDVPREEAAERQVEFVASDVLESTVVVKGELGTYLDHCPEPLGCLAVEYSRTGSIRHVWPLRLAEIGDANIVAESVYPYEHPVGWSLQSGVRRTHISQFPSGDLLVVFALSNSYPYGGGVARVAPDGQPRWYRKDYSHHWPHVVDEDLALVPAMSVSRSRLSYDLGRGYRRRTMELVCDHSSILDDQVSIINGLGEALERFSILDAIARSRYAGHLVGTNGCDPTHLNSIYILGDDVADGTGLAPGDLVVSLREISAFGIFDKSDRRLKRLVRGSFHMQHGVRHFGQARFVMFDNHGTDGVHGPSRLLMVDLETGKESTLFPTDTTPASLRLGLTRVQGHFDISVDRSRALVSDPTKARALEIRLADGEVLNVFHAMHDMSSLPWTPKALTQKAWLFQLHGIHYGKEGVVGVESES